MRFTVEIFLAADKMAQRFDQNILKVGNHLRHLRSKQSEQKIATEFYDRRLYLSMIYLFIAPGLLVYITTQCKMEVRILSGGVTKILTLHGMSKIDFQPEFRNAVMLSFLMMEK